MLHLESTGISQESQLNVSDLSNYQSSLSVTEKIHLMEENLTTRNMCMKEQDSRSAQYT
jgi:hypothetical protein